MISIKSKCTKTTNLILKPLQLNIIKSCYTTTSSTTTTTTNTGEELKWEPTLFIKSNRIINKFGDNINSTTTTTNTINTTSHITTIKSKSYKRIHKEGKINPQKRIESIHQEQIKKQTPSLASTFGLNDKPKRSFDVILENINNDLLANKEVIKIFDETKYKRDIQKPLVFNTFLKYFARHHVRKSFEEILTLYKRNENENGRYQPMELEKPNLNTIMVKSINKENGEIKKFVSSSIFFSIPLNNHSYSIILDYYRNEIEAYNSIKKVVHQQIGKLEIDEIIQIDIEGVSAESTYEYNIKQLKYWLEVTKENTNYHASLERTNREGIKLIISSISALLVLGNEKKAVQLFIKVKDNSCKNHHSLSTRFLQYYADNQLFEIGKNFIIDHLISSDSTPISQIGNINIDFIIKLFNNSKLISTSSSSSSSSTSSPTPTSTQSVENNELHYFLLSIEQILITKYNNSNKVKFQIPENQEQAQVIVKEEINDVEEEEEDDEEIDVEEIEFFKNSYNGNNTKKNQIFKPLPINSVNHFYKNIITLLLKNNERTISDWIFQNYCKRYKPTYEIYFETLVTIIEQERILDCAPIFKQMYENTTHVDMALEFSLLELCSRKRNISYLNYFIKLQTKNWGPQKAKLATFLIYTQINGHELIFSKLKDLLFIYSKERVGYTIDCVIRYLLFIDRYDLALYWYGERNSTYKVPLSTKTVNFFLAYHKNHECGSKNHSSSIESLWKSRLDLCQSHLQIITETTQNQQQKQQQSSSSSTDDGIESDNGKTITSTRTYEQLPSQSMLELPPTFNLLNKNSIQAKELIKNLTTLDRLTPVGKVKYQIFNSKDSISFDQLKEYTNTVINNSGSNNSGDGELNINNINLINELPREKIDFSLEMNINNLHIDGIYYELQDQFRRGIIKNGISFMKAIQFLKDQDKFNYFTFINDRASPAIRSIIFDDLYYSKVIKSDLEYGMKMLQFEDNIIWRKSSAIWNAVIIGLLNNGKVQLASNVIDCASKLNKRLISSEIQVAIENAGPEKRISQDAFSFIQRSFLFHQQYTYTKENNNNNNNDEPSPVSPQPIIENKPSSSSSSPGRQRPQPRKKKDQPPKIDYNSIMNDLDKFTNINSNNNTIN